MRYCCWVVGYGCATLAGYGSYIAGYGGATLAGYNPYVVGYGGVTLASYDTYVSGYDTYVSRYGTYIAGYGGATLADDAALRIDVEAGPTLTLLGDTVPDQRVTIIILVDRVNPSLQHQ